MIMRPLVDLSTPTAQAFQLLLLTSNWPQLSSSSKLYDFFPVGESRLLWYKLKMRTLTVGKSTTATAQE